jgi:hypothetical protein
MDDTGPHLCEMAKHLYEYVKETFCKPTNENDDDTEPHLPPPPRQNSDEIAEGTQPLPPPALPSPAIQRAQLVLWLIVQIAQSVPVFSTPSDSKHGFWRINNPALVKSNWQNMKKSKSFENKQFIDWWNARTQAISEAGELRDDQFRTFADELSNNFVQMYKVVSKVVPPEENSKLDLFSNVYEQLKNNINTSDYTYLAETTAFLCARAALENTISPPDDTSKYAVNVGNSYKELVLLILQQFCYGNDCKGDIVADTIQQATLVADDEAKIKNMLLEVRSQIEKNEGVLDNLQKQIEKYNKVTTTATVKRTAPLTHQVMFAQMAVYTIVKCHALRPAFLVWKDNNIDWLSSNDYMNENNIQMTYLELSSKDNGFNPDFMDGTSADKDTHNEFHQVWEAYKSEIAFSKASSLLRKFVKMYNLVRIVVTPAKDDLTKFSQVYTELRDLHTADSSSPDVREAVLATAFVCAHYALDNNTINEENYSNGYVKQVAAWIKRSKEIQTLKNKFLFMRHAFLKKGAKYGIPEAKDGKQSVNITLVDSDKKAIDFDPKFVTNELAEYGLLGGHPSTLLGGHPPTDQSSITNTLRRYARFVRLSTKGEPTLADFYWHVRYPESIFQYRQKLLTNLEMPSQSQALAQAYEDKQVLTQWMRLQNRQVTATASGELINVGGNANADNEEQEDEEEEEEDQEEDEEDQEEEDDDQEEDEEDQEEDEEEEEDDDQEEAQKRGQNMSSFAPIMQQLAQVFEKSSPQTVQNELCWVR